MIKLVADEFSVDQVIVSALVKTDLKNTLLLEINNSYMQMTNFGCNYQILLLYQPL